VPVRGIEIEPGVMNAACNIAKSPEDVQALAATGIGAVLVGSITVNERKPNPAPQWFDGGAYALNSFGMPNGGIDYYDEYLPGMIRTTHEANKKFVLSIAGFSAEDYGKLAALAEKYGPDILELNLGCPNVVVDGIQKPIASFDEEYISEIVNSTKAETELPLTVKLSPYRNLTQLKSVATTLTELKVDGVVTMNSFPISTPLNDEGNSVLGSPVGGVSGAAIRQRALRQVREFREALPDSIAVIGVGGIETAQHVELFRQAGASAVQAATLIVRNNNHAAMNDLITR
jgi:dihydroorotate dehydrogenase (fumarate)